LAEYLAIIFFGYLAYWRFKLKINYMDLPIIYHPDYVAPLPEGHRFPMLKFRQLYELLLADGVAQLQQFHIPESPHRELIQLVHTSEYVQAYCNGTLDPKAQRRIGLPWSPALVNRTCVAVGGTILTAKLALTQGLACNTAGGTHHAFPSYGSGFCIFNDLAIACRVLQKLNLAKKILIVDLDVHQGDGTALSFKTTTVFLLFRCTAKSTFPAPSKKAILMFPYQQEWKMMLICKPWQVIYQIYCQMSSQI
jgi:acetoin utilization deacetylase AcuC-like enzyme